MYIENPHLKNPRFHKLFCRRFFRMPYKCFLELVEMMNGSSLSERWREGKVDAVHQPATPITLLVFCVPRYIGQGWTFDGLSENTGISEEIICVFLHKFIKFGSTVLYKRYVVAPATSEEALQHIQDYERAGLPGCVGSMDATHILLEKVEYRLRQSHLGFKSSHTAQTCNITVSNRQKILAATTGHPARWNDKLSFSLTILRSHLTKVGHCRM